MRWLEEPISRHISKCARPLDYYSHTLQYLVLLLFVAFFLCDGVGANQVKRFMRSVALCRLYSGFCDIKLNKLQRRILTMIKSRRSKEKLKHDSVVSLCHSSHVKYFCVPNTSFFYLQGNWDRLNDVNQSFIFKSEIVPKFH